MIIECNKKELLTSVSCVRRSVNNKSTIQALEGILIRAYEGVITLYANNFGFGVKTFFNTRIIEEGEVVISGKVFYDIVRTLPDEKVRIEVNDKNIVNIKSGYSEFNIAGGISDEFPIGAKIDELYSIKMPSNLLKDMIAKTIFSAASEVMSVVHNGILFEIERDKIRLVAIDGYRLALREEYIINENITDKKTIIIPERTLSEILNLLPDNDQEIKIAVSDSHIVLTAENFELFSIIINDKFLNYRSIIPNDIKTSFLTKTKEMLHVVERVSLIVEEKFKKPMLFEIKDEIKISCESSIGEACDKLDAFVNGENINIAFNNRYVIEALRHIDVDEILVEIESDDKPMKITSPENKNFMLLILPVRI